MSSNVITAAWWAIGDIRHGRRWRQRAVKHFELIGTDSRSAARAGILHTAHGSVETPVFMPVGTNGTVKAVSQETLAGSLQAQLILANTYHLHLRPGEDIVREAGGLHRFMKWSRPVLTDSGGYQVYSLAANRKLRDDGVHFQSHIDGSSHIFTPESVIAMQRSLGPDIMMILDDCTPYPAPHDQAEISMLLTHRWLDLGVEAFRKQQPVHGYEQFLYPIVQGSVYSDLRKRSAEDVSSHDLPGNAIGGLSVGEPEEQLYQMTELCCGILPRDKPRYLMGVGTPENILRCIRLGVDMFDCVIPTRHARNGQVFTAQGTLNLRNKKWERDFSPLDEASPLPAGQYSKAYVRHLFNVDEILAYEIATIQNLWLYLNLVRTAREKILAGEFAGWCDTVIPAISRRL